MVKNGNGAIFSSIAGRLSRWQDTLWWVALVFLVVVRMHMTATDEIVPIRDDSTNYVKYSVLYLDTSAHLSLPPQSPGLSLVAAAGRNLGIPYKLWLDGLLVLAAWWVATTFRSWTRSRICGLALFSSIALNPWFMNHATLFMSEPLTSILVLLMPVAAATFVIRDVRRWPVGNALAAGSVMALYALTRPESILASCFWSVVVAAVLWRQRTEVPQLIRGRSSWRWVLVVLPWIMMLLAVWITQRYHLATYGVAALSTSEAPGFRSLLNALYRIPPDQQLRYAPVTYQSLAAACDASPTLGAKRDVLLDRRGSQYRSAERNLNLDGEFGTWLNWLLVEAFGGVNGESDRAMAKSAEEIRQAQQQGILGYRAALFPIDPLWRQWLPEFPSVFGESIQQTIWPNYNYLSSPNYVSGRQVKDLVEAGLFDDGLLRRAGTNPQSVARIYGLLRRPTTQFQEVRLMARETVVATAPIVAASDQQPSFELIVRQNPNVRSLNQCVLAFVRDDEVISTVALRKYMERERILVATESRDETGAGLEKRPEPWLISASSPLVDLQQKQQSRRRWAQRWQVLAIGVFLAIFIISLSPPTSKRVLVGMRFVLLITAAWFFGRLAFMALIHVWLNWGLHRYAETNHILAIFLFAVLSYCLGIELRAAIRGVALRRAART